jgi:hypothetical protein
MRSRQTVCTIAPPALVLLPPDDRIETSLYQLSPAHMEYGNRPFGRSCGPFGVCGISRRTGRHPLQAPHAVWLTGA